MFAYDAASQLQHLINYSPSNAILSKFDYTYDSLGRRTGMTAPDGSWTYGYDGDGQLVSVTMPGGSAQYSYDAAGNRTGSTLNGVAANYNTNNLNEYTAAGSSGFNYDADGNLISGGGWTYTYDDDDHITSMTSATDAWTYQYDGLGNRIAATHNGTAVTYLNDPSGLGIVDAELDGTGNLISHYTHGIDLASSVAANGAAAYYQFDGSGNTAQLTNSSGSVVNSYSYLPFGEKLNSTVSVSNPFTFVGQYGVMDEGSGLYLMRQRWYNPSLGRFIQLDPYGLGGDDSNFYRYTFNSPTNLVDPTGNFSLIPDVVTFGGSWFGVGASISINLNDGNIYGTGEATLTMSGTKLLPNLNVGAQVMVQTTEAGPRNTLRLTPSLLDHRPPLALLTDRLGLPSRRIIQERWSVYNLVRPHWALTPIQMG